MPVSPAVLERGKGGKGEKELEKEGQKGNFFFGKEHSAEQPLPPPRRKAEKEHTQQSLGSVGPSQG